MLRRALIQQKSPLISWLASIGAILGVLLLCVAVQFYTDITRVLDSNKELLRSDYIPVHKKIGNSVLSSLSAQGFTDEELEEMREQPFSKGVGIIDQGLFKVSGSLTPAEGMPGMYTELFFESLDDKYVDIKPEEWQWEKGSNEVPIILPGAYLEMYNFGMAPSQNLPVLNAKTLTQFRFILNISGRGQQTKMKGRIAGFSNRINSILVPRNFLNWANEIYGYRNQTKIVHVIWEVNDVSDPRIETFLNDHRYDTNEELLSGNRAKSVLNLVLAVFLVLGSVMVFLSLLVFILYNQLLIARKEYNLKVLFALGYTRRKLVMLYLRRYFLLVFIISGFSITGIILAQQFVSTYFDKYLVEHSQGVHMLTWLVFGASVALLVLLNSFTLFRLLSKLAARPGQVIS
ncbi:MAG: FtsX-like permease family protein [Flavobacteriales bacterium]